MTTKLRSVAPLVLAVPLGLLLLALANINFTPANKQQDAGPQDPLERTKLTWRVKEAKAKGQRQLTLRAPMIEYTAGASGTDEVLSKFSAVIAEPVEERSYVWDSTQILTWHKFRIIENLSHAELSACAECQPFPDESLPRELLPLSADEVLVARYGGSVTLDGVRVTTIDPDFPAFSKSKRYLLLLSKYPNGVAALAGGPDTASLVEDDGTLTPINKRPHAFKRDVEGRFGRSIHRIKDYLKSEKASR